VLLFYELLDDSVFVIVVKSSLLLLCIANFVFFSGVYGFLCFNLYNVFVFIVQCKDIILNDNNNQNNIFFVKNNKK
jgi:hypothetical protein